MWSLVDGSRSGGWLMGRSVELGGWEQEWRLVDGKKCGFEKTSKNKLEMILSGPRGAPAVSVQCRDSKEQTVF